MADIITSIKAIKADAHVSVSNEDVNKITWHDNNPTNITNQQILDKQIEITARDAYIRPRRKAYPSSGDQLDMIYHDQMDGTTTFKDAIKAIKDANPKP